MYDFQEIGKNLPFGLLVVNYKGKMIFINRNCANYLNITKSDEKSIQDVLPGSTIIRVIKEGKFEINDHSLYSDFYLLNIPLVQKELGLILFLPKSNFDELVHTLPKVMDLKQELEAIMNLSGEMVTITDGKGTVLRVNNTCEQILGVKEYELLGKSVETLEKNGVINTSSTKTAMQQKRKITLNQTTKSGRRLMVEAHPIFNEDGSLGKVINISKDMTEVSLLKKKLEELNGVVNYYQTELNRLHKQEEDFVFKSKSMEKVYELASRVADVDATIYLHGETGVGKEILARTIHKLSNRKDAPFIKINCGAIPESIMESELFGYAKGSFTGANKEGKKGLALAADKGTLFLDEIGELPLHLQAKLLQLLQEKQFTPIGGTEPVQVDVRFIAATNRNLEEMVRQGSFREDLYYRLLVIPITIPPLSERKEDIPFLINYFLEKYNQKYKTFKTFDQEVFEIFIEYEWKGNVRELQNTMERLILTTPAPNIELKHLPDQFLKSVAPKTSTVGNLNLKQEMEQFEKQILKKVLGNSSTMKEASTKLGVDASTITRKVQKYKIDVAKLHFPL